MNTFKNLRVLVSGSGTGIGHGVARAFAREGADVAERDGAGVRDCNRLRAIS